MRREIADELVAIEGVAKRPVRRVDSSAAELQNSPSMLRDDLLFRVARSLIDFPVTTAPAAPVGAPAPR